MTRPTNWQDCTGQVGSRSRYVGPGLAGHAGLGGFEDRADECEGGGFVDRVSLEVMPSERKKREGVRRIDADRALVLGEGPRRSTGLILVEPLEDESQ